MSDFKIGDKVFYCDEKGKCLTGSVVDIRELKDGALLYETTSGYLVPPFDVFKTEIDALEDFISRTSEDLSNRSYETLKLNNSLGFARTQLESKKHPSKYKVGDEAYVVNNDGSLSSSTIHRIDVFGGVNSYITASLGSFSEKALCPTPKSALDKFIKEKTLLIQEAEKKLSKTKEALDKAVKLRETYE